MYCLFCVVLCIVCVCVLYYCHRVATQMQLTNICLIISYTIPEDRRTQSHRAESLKSRTVDPFLSFSLPFFDYTWPQQLVPCLSSSSNFIITRNTRYRISLIHSIPHQTHTNTHPHTHSHVTRHSVCMWHRSSFLIVSRPRFANSPFTERRCVRLHGPITQWRRHI